MEPVTLDLACQLYLKYQEPLARVRDEQRRLHRERGMKAQLDDVEAELTYLLLRDTRPASVVEIGCLHGWSTSWILSALRDNGTGTLTSFDRIDNARRNVPAELAGDGRWTFVHGNVYEEHEAIPETDYLFIDAAHSAAFARWYLRTLFPRLVRGTRVSVHDVFHGRRAKPFSEGSVLLRYLDERGIDPFTVSPARAPEVHARLLEVKRELGLAEPVRTARDNPMVFFSAP